jgi:hypothetical protein
MALRLKLWDKLVNEWNICDKLPAIVQEIGLDELKDTYIDAILSGKTRGRVVVKLKEHCCAPEKEEVLQKEMPGTTVVNEKGELVGLLS